MQIKFHNGYHHFIGKLDDMSDLSPLLEAGDVIRINMRQLSMVTSHGIKVWIDFTKKLKGASLEILGAPQTFVDMMTFVPESVPDINWIRSFLYPVLCRHCDSEGQSEIFMKSFLDQHENDEVLIKCPSCHKDNKADEALLDLADALLEP